MHRLEWTFDGNQELELLNHGVSWYGLTMYDVSMLPLSFSPSSGSSLCLYSIWSSP
ncbi:putative aspartyl aminopeptidase [Iris pallida]|uniref:Aspartyl aminopeptidase n=1 Tax=Iris pallida TaxID=29817 RepID=A0AAX6IB45_IRIPA|nr:putative aspartyl aminopeptidase [Iris pallida]